MARIRVTKETGQYGVVTLLDVDVTYLLGSLMAGTYFSEQLFALSYPFSITTALDDGHSETKLVEEVDPE